MAGDLLGFLGLFFSVLTRRLSFALLGGRGIAQLFNFLGLFLNGFFLGFQPLYFLGQFLKLLELGFLFGLILVLGELLQLLL